MSTARIALLGAVVAGGLTVCGPGAGAGWAATCFR
jgi:hypothetical protein